MDHRGAAVRRGVDVGIAGGSVLVFLVLLLAGPNPTTTTADGMSAVGLLSSVGQLAAAALATVATARRASRSFGRVQMSWLLVALASSTWAIGRLTFATLTLTTGTTPRIGNAADVGALLMLGLILLALIVRPSDVFVGRARIRLLLDGSMVAASLFAIGWVSALASVVHAGGHDRLHRLVLIGYPVGSLLVLSVTVIVLAHSRARLGLLAFGGGLAALGAANIGYAYLAASNSYRSGLWLDIGWFGAFVFIGLSARLSDVGPSTERAPSTVSAPYLFLPYLLAGGGVAVAIRGALIGHLDRPTIVVASYIAFALLARQLLTLLDNRTLVRDVESQQGELRYRAFHDTLTGLANRALFNDRVAHAVDLHRRDERPVAVLFCDLDDFKSVNDTLGHEAGDVLLRAVADRMRVVVRSGDTVARLGGDEFAVLVEDDCDLGQLCRRLLEELAVPVEMDDRSIPVRASIGVAGLGREDSTVDSQELLKRADLAMYAAKQAGKSTYRRYSKLLRDLQLDDLDLRLALGRDVAARRIRVVYQPIIRADGTIYGWEALARWSYQGREVDAERFIPIAERSGLISDLDLQVIEQAVAELSRVPDGPNAPVITVNVCLSHLADRELPARISAVLANHQLDPSRLVIEVPEQQSIDEPVVAVALRDLRRSGVRVALDDFGVGYSSLGRISALDPHVIKLDRTFVSPVPSRDGSERILAAIIDLAHRVGAKVVAEGVETDAQRAVLTKLGCDAMQGYLFGVPTVSLQRAPRTRPAAITAGPVEERTPDGSGDAVSVA